MDYPKIMKYKRGNEEVIILALGKGKFRGNNYESIRGCVIDYKNFTVRLNVTLYRPDVFEDLYAYNGE